VFIFFLSGDGTSSATAWKIWQHVGGN